MEEKVIDIEELAQDKHNFNKGNDEGQQLMERSFKELGAGRTRCRLHLHRLLIPAAAVRR